MNRFSAADAALLFLRIEASVLMLLVHGLPKVIHYTSQLDAIEAIGGAGRYRIALRPDVSGQRQA